MSEILRKYATPLSMAVFILISVTGLLMFFHIRNGRMNDLHEWFGIAFVAIVLLHLLRNARGFMLLLKQPRSLIVVALIAGGGLFAVWNTFNNPGPGAGLGSPRAAQAEVLNRLSAAPISRMAPVLGLTGADVIARLERHGVSGVGADMSLNQVSERAGKPSYILYLMIFPQNKGGKRR